MAMSLPENTFGRVRSGGQTFQRHYIRYLSKGMDPATGLIAAVRLYDCKECTFKRAERRTPLVIRDDYTLFQPRTR